MSIEEVRRKLNILVGIIFVLVIIILLRSWFPVHISRDYERTKAVVTDKVERIRPVNACNIHEYKVWYSYRVGNASYENATGWIEGEVSDRMTGIDIRYNGDKPWKSMAEKERQDNMESTIFFGMVLVLMSLAWAVNEIRKERG